MKQNHIDHNAVESRKVLDLRKAWPQIKSSSDRGGEGSRRAPACACHEAAP